MSTPNLHLNLNGMRHSLSIQKGENILDVLLLSGVSAKSSCQSGSCTVCKLKSSPMTQKLLSNVDPKNNLSKEEKKQGWILACQAIYNGSGEQLQLSDY